MPRPPEVLTAPAPVQPVRAGLLLSATGPMDMPVHVTDVGAQWWSDACGNARLYPAGCLDTPYYPYVLDEAGGLEGAYPFNVYATTVCPPVGVDAAEARARVLRRLQAGESKQVERALWGGQAAIDHPTGTDTPVIKGLFQLLFEAVPSEVTLLAGTATSVQAAVSQLEQHAAESSYNGPLLIHARPAIAAYAGGAGLMRDRTSSDGERQFTHAGSEWVFGRGYSGASPDGATGPDGTTEYMFITGRVLVWRGVGDPVVSEPDQVLDKVTNQRGMVAVRPYAIGVECFAAAVKVTRA